MRKSFTRLFGFLLLNVMMLFSYGLYAQGEAQSTVELKAPTIDACYNVTNSYAATVQTRDFIGMKSFDLTLNYDKSEFGVTSVTPVAALGGTFTTTVDATAGTINLKWSSSTAVSLGDNAYANLFTVNFNVLNFPNNSGDNLFDSSLAWASTSKFYYGENFTGSYQVSTTALTNGNLNVSVNYTGIQYNVTPAGCSGGQAAITVTSPVGTGLQYSFNGGAFNASTSATADAPSTAYVRVKDANGCYSHLFSVPVTAPAALVLNGVTTATPTCFDGNGEIQFSISGGTAPYTYWVVPAANIGTVTNTIATSGTGASSLTQYKYTNFIVLKKSGAYKVAVSDANGCVDLALASSWKDAVIGDAPAAINFAVGTTTATCNGYADGAIAISSLSGGTTSPSGTYSLSINGTTWTTTTTFSGLVGGTYTVTAKDFNGCTTAKSVAVPQPSAITFSLTYQDVACGGTVTPTGAINITGVSGGTSTYTFAVATSGTVTATTGPASGWVGAPGTIGSLSAGYYSVWVKDNNNCVKAFVNPDGSGNVLPIQKPEAIAIATSADNAAAKEVACYGGAYTLTVSVTGGVAPYSYSYNSGATTTSTSYNVGGSLTTDTSVQVVVTDASGCTLTKTVTVNVATPLLASYNSEAVVDPTCPSGNDGRVTVLTNSGGTAPYKYSTDNSKWYDNNVLAIPEGTTSLYVKDAAGCTASTSVTVDPLTTNVIAATATNVTCNGVKDGTINLTISSWVDMARTKQYLVATSADGTFAAFTPGTLNGGLQQTPTTFDAGTYYVKVKDELGCTSGTVSVTITQPAALGLTAAVTDATCFGMFDGTITINTTGGSGHPEYAYANNLEALTSDHLVFQSVGTWSETTHIGKQVIQVQRGTYYIKIRDVAPCGESYLTAGPFVVNGYKAITFAGTIAKTDITCNDATDGTITVPLAGVKGGKPEFDGVSSYIFTLAKPAGGTVTNTTGAFTGLTNGTYTITISDASSCSSSTVLPVQTIIRPDAITIQSVSVTHFTCKGSRDGIISVTAAGSLVGGYQLAVNASVNGTIKESDWLNFGTSTSTTTKQYVATEPGTYYLYVRDANKCMGNTVSVTVLEPAALTLTGVVTDVTCAGPGQVTLAAGGGWSPTVTQTYTYKVGTATLSGTSTNTLAAGSYTASAMVNSGVYTATTTANGVTYVYPQIGCAAEYAFTVKDLVAYKYSASVTNVKCKDGSDGALTVTVLAGTVATHTTTGDEYFVQLTTTTSPALQAASWTRTTSQKVTFGGLPHGIYSVWISNGNHIYGASPIVNPNNECLLPVGTETPTDGVFTKVASWEVNEPSTALTASITFNNDVTCNAGTDGKFTINAVGGSGSYTYAAKLSTIPTGHILTPEPAAAEYQASPVFNVAAGTYVIWVKDSNGCIVGGEGSISNPYPQYRVVIGQPGKVTFTTAASFSGCYGTSGGVVTVTTSVSAGAPYTYVVTGTDYTGAAVNVTGTTTSVITGLLANKTLGSTATNVYTITWTDKNGCSTSSPTTTIVQNAAVTATLAKAAGAFLCPGDVTGVIEASAVGGTGTGTYTYRLWRDGAAYTTTFGSIPSFIVQVGHTYKVEVKDGAGCSVFTDEQTINEPVGITATMQETTCFSDPTASVIVKAVGETGRTFSVQYKANTAANYTAWEDFDGEIALSGFIFANSVVTQNFYYFNVKDNMGCTTSYTYSFVATQNELKATVAGVGGSATMTITGGIAPYSLQVGTASMTELTGSVSGGSYPVAGLVDGTNTITVFDAHGCSKVVTYVADLNAPLAAAYSPNGTTSSTTNNHPQLVITFNEDVVVGTGSVKIMKKSDNTLAIPAIAASAITASGKTATVTYAGGLDKFTEYYVTIDAGVVKDLAGNAFAGTTATSTWTFKTGDFATPVVPVIPTSLEYKVYPNPFVDYVIVDNASELTKVVVTNIAGQVVKEVVTPDSRIELNQLVSGVYFISLYEENTVVKTVKIVKR